MHAGPTQRALRMTPGSGLLAFLAVLSSVGCAATTVEVVPSAASKPVEIKAEVAASKAISLRHVFGELDTHGKWRQVAPLGDVWVPHANAASGWRPYVMGRWIYSDRGWLWSGLEPWSWATDHYGRWVWHRSHRWVWLPGRDWAPAWVGWRHGGGCVGWAPMEVDDRSPEHVAYWLFVPQGVFTAPRLDRLVIPAIRLAKVFAQSELLSEQNAITSAGQGRRTGTGPPRERVERWTTAAVMVVSVEEIAGIRILTGLTGRRSHVATQRPNSRDLPATKTAEPVGQDGPSSRSESGRPVQPPKAPRHPFAGFGATDKRDTASMRALVGRVQARGRGTAVPPYAKPPPTRAGAGWLRPHLVTSKSNKTAANSTALAVRPDATVVPQRTGPRVRDRRRPHQRIDRPAIVRSTPTSGAARPYYALDRGKDVAIERTKSGGSKSIIATTGAKSRRSRSRTNKASPVVDRSSKRAGRRR